MIFYCYNIAEFEKSGRGFYGDYEKIVPGPTAFKTEDIINLINKGLTNNFEMNEFLDIYLENCDGNSTKRLYNLLKV